MALEQPQHFWDSFTWQVQVSSEAVVSSPLRQDQQPCLFFDSMKCASPSQLKKKKAATGKSQESIMPPLGSQMDGCEPQNIVPFFFASVSLLPREGLSAALGVSKQIVTPSHTRGWGWPGTAPWSQSAQWQSRAGSHPEPSLAHAGTILYFPSISDSCPSGKCMPHPPPRPCLSSDWGERCLLHLQLMQ